MIAWLVAATTTIATIGGSNSGMPSPMPILVTRVVHGTSSIEYGAAESLCLKGRPVGVRSRVDLRSFLRALSRPGIERVVIFLPGFSTSFTKGLVEAQRLAVAFGPRDQVVYVDWDGGNTRLSYVRAARHARRNAVPLAEALTLIHTRLPGREIDVFAHSMGARVVAYAMPLLRPLPHKAPIAAHVVLGAPDVGVEEYRRIAAQSPHVFGHITVYSSQKDKALRASEILNKNSRLGRLMKMVQLPNTDIVDATSVSPSKAGHFYPVDDDDVMRDEADNLAGASIPHLAWQKTRIAGAWLYAKARAATAHFTHPVDNFRCPRVGSAPKSAGMVSS